MITLYIYLVFRKTTHDIGVYMATATAGVHGADHFQVVRLPYCVCTAHTLLRVHDSRLTTTQSDPSSSSILKLKLASKKEWLIVGPTVQQVRLPTA